MYLGERLLPVAFLTRRGDRSTSITSPGPSCTDTTDGAVILRRLCSSCSVARAPSELKLHEQIATNRGGVLSCCSSMLNFQMNYICGGALIQ